MGRATPRRRPRTEYRTDAPPRDGTEIVVSMWVALTVYWDEEMQCWVLSRPFKIETLDRSLEINRWRRKRPVAA
jgi:hypothetical protein